VQYIDSYRFGKEAFSITIDTTLGDGMSQFTLPTRSGYLYNATVKWGDGNSSKITAYDDADITHSYSAGGEYTIEITGEFQSWYFNNGGDKDKLKSINAWGNVGFLALDGAFYGCTNLESLPDGAITGADSVMLFQSMFRDCTSLLESLPALFSFVSGTPAANMFLQTFYGCSGLTGSIPSGLFGTLSGAPASSMFQQTFRGCSGLTGSIPSGLFGTLSGAPASSMFVQTFYGCSGLTGSIPSGLFETLSGAPASSMFQQTFLGCSGLTGSIPSGLFGTLSGAPASSMFQATFLGCSGLTGSIPSGLFGTLSGTPATSMFFRTFDGCSGLTGSIPSGLFGTLSGTPATSMFYLTFEGCSGLTDIGNAIWDLTGLSNTSAANMFYQTFANCTSATSSTPTMSSSDTTELWNYFTAYTGQGAFLNDTSLSNYASIPADWK
jgi:hypothetical protein